MSKRNYKEGLWTLASPKPLKCRGKATICFMWEVFSNDSLEINKLDRHVQTKNSQHQSISSLWKPWNASRGDFHMRAVRTGQRPDRRTFSWTLSSNIGFKCCFQLFRVVRGKVTWGILRAYALLRIMLLSFYTFTINRCYKAVSLHQCSVKIRSVCWWCCR